MRRLLLVIALALGASAAYADNGSFYIGAAISKDKLTNVFGTPLADIDGTSWKLFAGVRPINFFALEADYFDLGSRTTSLHSDAKAFAAYGVGFLPIPVPFLDVFGKAGVSRVKLNGSTVSPLPPVSLSTNGTEFAWGGGAQLHTGNVGARLEYERFVVPRTNGANVVSLGVYLNIF